MAQVGNLETLIGSHALYSDHALLLRPFHCEEAQDYAFGLPGRSVSPHVDSDKLRNELQAKNKCPESQKLDTRRRRENLIAISPRVTKSNNIVCTHYVKVFCILCLSIILFDTSKALENLTFILTAKSHSVEFLYM